MDETGADYTEWSKSERETPVLCINTYIWNLERWLWCLCKAAKETEAKNRLLDSVGEGKGGMI